MRKKYENKGDDKMKELEDLGRGLIPVRAVESSEGLLAVPFRNTPEPREIERSSSNGAKGKVEDEHNGGVRKKEEGEDYEREAKEARDETQHRNVV